MRVAVAFENERVELDVPDGRLLGAWQAPAGAEGEALAELVASALENPRDYPAIRQAIVPGDQVAIACAADLPGLADVLASLGRVIESAGVEPGAITVLADTDEPERFATKLPPGIVFRQHDPDDRTALAYLASTTSGRRVYLNRALTDADLVVPVGRLGYDPVLGYQGPWSVIFPGLSDTATKRAFQASITDALPARSRPSVALVESTEVTWLLGSQFQLGLVEGASGATRAVSGLAKSVLDHGSAAVDDAWSMRAESRAELVVAGIGQPGQGSRIADVARGLATASRLVQRGGKIVVLSRAEGPIGPAMQRLAGSDDPRRALAALRGHEGESDYVAARQLAQALAWADVYLLSALGSDTVEDLSMIALDRPEEARRLANASSACLVVSQADRVRASVADETE